METKPYLNRDDVTLRYSISTTTLYRWIDEGIFPKPHQLGPRAVRWKLTDLEQWEKTKTI